MCLQMNSNGVLKAQFAFIYPLWGRQVMPNFGQKLAPAENKNRYFSGQSMMTNEQANTIFKSTFINELKKKMTGVAVSSGPCLGAIQKGRPIFDFYGVCLESQCKC